MHNPHENVQLPTPIHIEDVPATLEALMDAWREFADLLEAEVKDDSTNIATVAKIAALGGTIGAFRMIVIPTLGNLADSIRRKLLELATAAATRSENEAFLAALDATDAEARGL